MTNKPDSPEYKAFENLLGKVISVPKAELNRRAEEEKRSPRGRASRVSDGPSKQA